jgi:hypothetical protein
MDRQLLEVRRAFTQKIAKLERDMRFLKRRVQFPGAVCSRRRVDIGPRIPSTDRALISCDLAPGRWRIDFTAQVHPTANCSITFQALGYNPDGGATTAQNDAFALGWASFLSTTGDVVTLPMAGHGIGDWPTGGRVDLALTVSGGTVSVLTIDVLSLIATPV